jgi:hypothetical protein
MNLPNLELLGLRRAVKVYTLKHAIKKEYANINQLLAYFLSSQMPLKLVKIVAVDSPSSLRH